jgi:PhnB protein
MANEMPNSPMNGVIPAVSLADADSAFDYYAKALGAKQIDRRLTEDGRVMHGHVEINGGAFMFNDAFPEYGMELKPTQNVILHLVVDDAAPWWKRAMDAGFEVVMPLELAFWGDFYGQMKDKFGITWAVVSSKNGGQEAAK